MRNLLLFACMAAFSVSASAQVKNEASYLSKMNTVCSPLRMETRSMVSGSKAAKPSVKKVMKAGESDGIYGQYIMSSNGLSNGPSFCDNVTLEKVDTLIKVNDTDEGTQCNVKFVCEGSSITYSYCGVYDEAKKTITCPALQYMASYTNTSTKVTYQMYLATLEGESLDDLNKVSVTDSPLTYTIDDDGNMTLDQLGIYMGIVDVEGYWTAWCSQEFKKANAVSTYTIYKEDCETPVYIEDYGTGYNIYNFLQMADGNAYGFGAIVGVDINDNGYLTMDANQNIWDAENLFGSSWTEEMGEYFVNYGITFGTGEYEGYVMRDTDLENGVDYAEYSQDGTAIGFYSFPVLSMPVTDPTTQEVGYYGTWASDVTITLNNGSFAGIKDVTANKTLNQKDTKCYNALGQQVSANAKGLVIRNGKKFYNK